MTKLADNFQHSVSISWPYYRSSRGVVVKLLACGVREGSIPGLAATVSEIGYLLLPSR